MTTPPRVQILLVSAQAAPNLLATLDPALKPQEVVLMVSAKMQPRAQDLEAVLREAGVKTTQIALANEHDFAALELAGRGLAPLTDDDETLREMIARSTRLQERVLRLDALLYGAPLPSIPSIAPSAIESQLQMLRRAFLPQPA